MFDGVLPEIGVYTCTRTHMYVCIDPKLIPKFNHFPRAVIARRHCETRRLCNARFTARPKTFGLSARTYNIVTVACL